MLQRKELEIVTKKIKPLCRKELEIVRKISEALLKAVNFRFKKAIVSFQSFQTKTTMQIYFPSFFFFFGSSNHFACHFHLITTFIFLPSTTALTYVFSSKALVSKDKVFRQMISSDAQLCSANFVWSICFIFIFLSFFLSFFLY